MFRKDPDPAGSLKNWPPRYGFESVSQDYRFAHQDPSERNIYGSTTLIRSEGTYIGYIDDRKFL